MGFMHNAIARDVNIIYDDSMLRRAIIFDFDGLIADTELADLVSWQETFREFGQDLDPVFLDASIGAKAGALDPIAELIRLAGRDLDRERVRLRKAWYMMRQIEVLKPLPGVVELIADARTQGIKTAIASNSSQTWVFMLLSQFGLLEQFDTVATSNEVTHAKPHPELYLLALKKLGLHSAEAVAIEDSPHGITAARAANLSVLAVPNPRTSRLDLSAASAKVASLREISLTQLLAIGGGKADVA